ncbi:MAG TPA: GNAT family N-acetyltransferase [Chloroflexota bacterium]
MSEELLPRRFRKVYDDGAVDDWLSSYSEALSLDSVRFAGAFADERLVGLATWATQEWNNCLWLVDIRVRGNTQRGGAGTRLIEMVKDEARRTTARGIRVETQTTNMPAIRFYLACGFRITGFDDHLYSNRDLDEQEIGLFLFWET